jgi:small ligand-binding sensory domain FIST
MAALSLPSWLKRGEAPASCQTALSRQPSLEAAVEEVAKALGNRGANDLALVFCSTSYASDLPRLLPLLRSRLNARHWIGCAGGGVVGTEASGQARELEQQPALSVTLLRLPGADLQLFELDPASLPDLDGDNLDWINVANGTQTITGGESHLWNVTAAAYHWARFTWTRSAGTGTVSAVFLLKESPGK